MISAAPTAGRVERTACGILFTARTGIKQRETQVACAINAARNLGGDFLISSNRESFPSDKTRWNRKDPHCHTLDTSFSRDMKAREVHLIAHIDTAVLSTTCLQFKPLGPPFPVKASKRLGKRWFGRHSQRCSSSSTKSRKIQAQGCDIER